MALNVRRGWVPLGPSILLAAIVSGLVGALALQALLYSLAGFESRRRSLTSIERDAYHSCEAFVRQRFTAFSAAKVPPAAHPDVRISRQIIEWAPFMGMPVPEPGSEGTAAAELYRRQLAEYWNDRSGEYYSVETFVVTPAGADAVVRSRVECQVRWPGPGQRWRLIDLQIGASDATAVSGWLR